MVAGPGRAAEVRLRAGGDGGAADDVGVAGARAPLAARAVGLVGGGGGGRGGRGLRRGRGVRVGGGRGGGRGRRGRRGGGRRPALLLQRALPLLASGARPGLGALRGRAATSAARRHQHVARLHAAAVAQRAARRGALLPAGHRGVQAAREPQPAGDGARRGVRGAGALHVGAGAAALRAGAGAQPRAPPHAEAAPPRPDRQLHLGGGRGVVARAGGVAAGTLAGRQPAGRAAARRLRHAAAAGGAGPERQRTAGAGRGRLPRGSAAPGAPRPAEKLADQRALPPAEPPVFAEAPRPELQPHHGAARAGGPGRAGRGRRRGRREGRRRRRAAAADALVAGLAAPRPQPNRLPAAQRLRAVRLAQPHLPGREPHHLRAGGRVPRRARARAVAARLRPGGRVGGRLRWPGGLAGLARPVRQQPHAPGGAAAGALRRAAHAAAGRQPRARPARRAGAGGAGGLGGGRSGDGAAPSPPRSNIFRMDLSGPDMGVVDLQELNRFQNLRSLAVSKLPRDTLSAEDLLNAGVDLQELRITRSNLRTVRSHAFAHARGLRVLDLAENEIAAIEPEAFAEVGHSLTSLRLDNGLASSFGAVPGEALRPLTNLVELDLSNNRLRTLPEYALLALRRLRLLRLADNQLEALAEGTFQRDVHVRLEEVDIGFNQLPEIHSHAFKDLPALKRLLLDDNQISRVGWQAFMNLPRLYELRLRGNKLTELPTEGFQNLPALRLLDVSWNALQALDLGAALDAVGTLAPSLVFNASHNSLWRLDSNGTGAPHVSVKVLDLSFNNLTVVSHGALRPVQTSLTRLLLSHNGLRNASRAAFGHLPRLQELDLAHNHLQEIDYNAFRDSHRLQTLDLSGNELMDVPAELFRELRSIRDVRLARNRLRALPVALFSEDGLRRLDLSHNLLARMPAASIATLAAASLVRLDLQWNAISALHGQDVFSRFKSLQWLDLSGNRLVRLEDAAFAALPRLAHLQLSHNVELQVDSRGRAFAGLRESLLSLSLDNTSLTTAPDLALPRLRHLSLAHNALAALPTDLALNLTDLRELDLSYNRFQSVPPATHAMPALRQLLLAGNPVTAVGDTSLLGVGERLTELDLRRMPLAFFEPGSLSKMAMLRTLRVSTYPAVQGLSVPALLHGAHALRTLHVDVPPGAPLTRELRGPLPHGLRNLTLTGAGLTELPEYLLEGVRGPELHLQLRNTSVAHVGSGVFRRAGARLRNLTLDVRNNSAASLASPAPASVEPGSGAGLFLAQLQMRGDHWQCDCELGWVEGWLRQRRQYLGRLAPDDLRLATCADRGNASLLVVLKEELECGWSSASGRPRPSLLAVVVSAATLLLGYAVAAPAAC